MTTWRQLQALLVGRRPVLWLFCALVCVVILFVHHRAKFATIKNSGKDLIQDATLAAAQSESLNGLGLERAKSTTINNSGKDTINSTTGVAPELESYLEQLQSVQNLSLLRVEGLTTLQKRTPRGFKMARLIAAADAPTFTVPVYIHAGTEDAISKSIEHQHVWEFDLLRHVLQLLLREDLHLIDLGANIGSYTLPAAHLGRTVVAVEPYRANYLRLGLGVLQAGVQERVTIVCNMIGCCQGRFVLRPQHGQMGMVWADYKVKADERICASLPPGEQCADAIELDELLPVINFRRALLKMDIEAHEGVAFEYAEKLFDRVTIPYILMEWKHIKQQNTVKTLLDFMKTHHYTARPSPNGGQLNGTDIWKWPDNVWWTKKYN